MPAMAGNDASVLLYHNTMALFPALTRSGQLHYDKIESTTEVTAVNPKSARSPRRRIPHARLFGKRLRRLQNDAHIARLLKQNLQLKALVRALSEKLLEGKSPSEVRVLLREVYVGQRQLYNEALGRQAIRQARNVDDLMAMLQEIDEDAG